MGNGSSSQKASGYGKLPASQSSDNISVASTQQVHSYIGLLNEYNGNYKNDQEKSDLMSVATGIVSTLASYHSDNQGKKGELVTQIQRNIVTSLVGAYKKSETDIKTAGVKGNVVKGVIDDTLKQTENSNLKSSFDLLLRQQSRSKF